MKQVFSLLIAIFCIQSVSAQQDKEAIFDKNNPVIWLGIDFSRLQFVGDASAESESSESINNNLKNKYFEGWNDLVLNEPKKYDIKAASTRNDIQTQTQVTRKVNQKSSGEFYLSDSQLVKPLTTQDIKSMLKQYSLEKLNGVGMVLIAEEMNKSAIYAKYRICFFDISTHKILLLETVQTKPGGFGFRNYWAKSIAEALDKTAKNIKNW